MTPRYGFYTLAMTTLLCIGCAGKALSPALPDDRIRFAPTAEQPLEEPGYATPRELADLAKPLPPIVRPPPLLRMDKPQKQQQPERQGCGRKQDRVHSPEQIVRSGNAEATVGPSQRGLKASAIVQYDHDEGSIYEVYAAPNAPAFVRLPPGHHLAAPATLNPEEWIMSKVEMTLPGEIDQQGWVIRPGKAGLQAYINIISKEGFVAKCKVTSFEKTAMLEVSWNYTPHLVPVLPLGIRQDMEGPPLASQAPALRPEERRSLLLAAMKVEQPKAAPVKLKTPSLNAERIHTRYTIAVVGKHTPPWVPVSVLDDGGKTLIKFKESLAFTSAPDLFALHPDGSPAPVEFTPYTSDNGETMMYIIPGLFPQLHLKGRNNLQVTITRVPNGTQK